jgi:hypothetical protein
MSAAFTRIFCSFGLALLVLGCGRPADPHIPVAGKVTVAGEPLKTGTIVFSPDPTAGSASSEEARGLIRDGAYSLTAGEKKGALPGHYKVAIYATEATDSTKPPLSLIDPIYNDPDRSKFKAEVRAAAPPAAYDFDLKK